MNVEFKVGDKLRFKAASNEYYTQGDVYEVVDYDEGNNLYILKLDDGVEFWHTKDVRECFRRIDEPQADQSEPQPKVAKVKLTQEQAQAIETALEKYNYDTAELLEIHARIKNYDKYHYAGGLEALSELSIADLARALLIGYTVEQTAEEKLAKYYQERKKWAQQTLVTGEKHRRDVNMAQVQAINATLSILGIKVKGIND